MKKHNFQFTRFHKVKDQLLNSLTIVNTLIAKIYTPIAKIYTLIDKDLGENRC
jgi:hypothetical protein